MDNHIHLLFSGTVPIATVMKRLLVGYAEQFNHKYKGRISLEAVLFVPPEGGKHLLLSAERACV